MPMPPSCQRLPRIVLVWDFPLTKIGSKWSWTHDCCSNRHAVSGSQMAFVVLQSQSRGSDMSRSRNSSVSPGMQRQGSSNRPSASPALQRQGSSLAQLHRQGSSPAMHRASSSAAMHQQGSGAGLLRQGSLAALIRQGSNPALQDALLRQASDRLRQGTASPALQQIIAEASALPRGSSPGGQSLQQVGPSSSSAAVLPRGSSPSGLRPSTSSSSVLTRGSSPARQGTSGLNRQGSAAVSRRPTQRQRNEGSSGGAVVAADFVRQEGFRQDSGLDRRAGSGLMSHLEADLAGRTERVMMLLLLEAVTYSGHDTHSGPDIYSGHDSPSIAPQIEASIVIEVVTCVHSKLGHLLACVHTTSSLIFWVLFGTPDPSYARITASATVSL